MNIEISHTGISSLPDPNETSFLERGHEIEQSVDEGLIGCFGIGYKAAGDGVDGLEGWVSGDVDFGVDGEGTSSTTKSIEEVRVVASGGGRDGTVSEDDVVLENVYK